MKKKEKKKKQPQNRSTSSGRATLWNNLNRDRVIIAYKRFGTLRKAAEAVGVSREVLRKALVSYGVDIRSRSEAVKINHRKQGHHGKFAKWLATMEGKPLPRNMTKLIAMSGCTKSMVSCYFYRRRKAIKDRLKALPDLRTIKATLKDEFGNSYDTSDFKSYSYLIDKFSLKVEIIIVLKSEQKLVIKVANLDRFARSLEGMMEVMKANQPPESSSLPRKRGKDHPLQHIQEPSEHSGSGDFLAEVPDTEL